MLAQIAGQTLRPPTRERLTRLHEALEIHRRSVDGLYEAAGVPTRDGDVERDGRVPGEGVATAYFDQIHRDWGWDDREVEAALEVVLDVVGEVRPKRMLVLGAGACRLPHALHRALKVETTVAIDVNPVPFFVAKRVLGGETVSLWEFPQSPRDSSSVAVERVLGGGASAGEGFELLFADGLQPPVPDAAFDAVFTPWFIDQVPENLVDLVPEINRVLVDGGAWINHGPLLYHPSHTQPAHRYREDEVLDIVREHGFDVLRNRWDRLTYMQSPAGSQGRTEGVATFLARKDTSVRRDQDDTPAWLEDPSVVIPRWPELDAYQAPHPMFAAVANLVDGTRSAENIADEMVRRFNLPADAALGGVTTCLSEMWRAGRS